MIPIKYDTITYDEKNKTLTAKSEKKTLNKKMPENHEEISLRHPEIILNILMPGFCSLR